MESKSANSFVLHILLDYPDNSKWQIAIVFEMPRGLRFEIASAVRTHIFRHNDIEA